MNRLVCCLGLAILAPFSPARAQAVAYTDEGAYLAALAAQGVQILHEGFEDDAVWGSVRTTISGGPQTAPSIQSQGLTWLPNNAGSEITTGSGPALSGLFGFFQLPHGDPAAGINDGFGATGNGPLIGIGGWIETNTPFAKVALFLDGVGVDFGGSTTIGTQHVFFGAIDPAGFSHFEYLELEATPGDWKLIFADEFSFAFGGSLVDCNQNGIADAFDIDNGFSADCNLNLLPDECEIDVNSSASGGPFFCTMNCDPDCNANGLLDECEVMVASLYASGQLSPFGAGFPQSFQIAAPASTLGNVLLDFRAYANLGGGDEYIDVDINGVQVGTVFVNGGDDCPDGGPDTAQLIVPEQTFNAIVAGGSASIGMLASSEVDVDDCNSPSYVEVDVTLFVASAMDQDADGIPDECAEFGARYCVGAPNSVYPGGAHVHATGSAIVADNDFVLETRDVPPSKVGIHYFGPDQVQLPFGDGLRCVGGSIQRLQGVLSNASGVAQAPVDLSLPPALGNLVPGATMNFQFWYRDPTGGPAGFNLSDALSIDFL